MYKLVFTSLGFKTQKHEIDPLTGESVLVDIKSNTYDKLPESRLNLSIKSIEPHIENGILKSLEFEIDNFNQNTINQESKFLAENEIDQNLKQMFKSKLPSIQRNVLDKFVNKVNELGDSKIFYDDKKEHFAIKYNKGRSKAWMVIKNSGTHLYLWIRVNPQNFKDPKNIAFQYRDESKTHGNRKINLTLENLKEVEYIIRQSYDFRKQDNYYKIYSDIVRDESYSP